MKAKFLTISFLSVASVISGASSAQEIPPPSRAHSISAYIGKVDPDAFPERPREHLKKGVVVNPATLRMIVPGIDKFSIYNLVGPPHFGEGIARRWNYVLFFPAAPGSTERLRCRMEIRFGPERTDGYNIAVSEVVWKEQACADRVAQAS